MYLSREAILAVDDLPTKEVPIPEWGGKVLVKTLTADERDRFEMNIINDDGNVDLNGTRARLAAISVVDEDGECIFTLADITALGKKSAAAVDRIFDMAQKLSGITNNDIELLVGNSETALN